MSNYINSVLRKEERIHYHAVVSVWSLLPLVIVGFFTLPIFGLGILFWVAAALKYMNTEMAITDQRILARFGLIKAETLDMALDDAERIEIEQSGLGRNLDYGAITIIGKGASYVPVTGIDKPERFRQMFMDLKKSDKAQPLKAAA